MQRSVTAYFNTRKRQATDELCNKAKILLLEHDQARTKNTRNKVSVTPVALESSSSPILISEQVNIDMSSKQTLDAKSSHPNTNSVVRNIKFDSPQLNAYKSPKINTRARAMLSRQLFNQDEQTDISTSLLKAENTADIKNVFFEKKGLLSPKKHASPRKEVNGSMELSSLNCTTPKKVSTMDRLAKQQLTLNDIKHRINASSRLNELKASIARIRNCDQRLQQLQNTTSTKPQIQKFDNIQLEIPLSPQKASKSPRKALFSPTKNTGISANASPQRRILHEPKETTPSPIKGSPTKTPAYQRYLSLTECDTPTLPLPYKYRFLAEAFRCVDTVSAMLYNRKEIITFKKLKPAVQELLRRNFTLDHVAQIKSIYPNAYTYRQEKHHTFGSPSKQEKYELVLTPIIKAASQTNNSAADIISQKEQSINMNPATLLERRRQFYKVLLDRVKYEHEKFLLGLETPMIVNKDKVLRWHPEFDVENCSEIESDSLPCAPTVEKPTSAKDVLEKAISLYNISLVNSKSKTETIAAEPITENKSTTTVDTETSEQLDEKTDNVAVVDTPPATPTTQNNYLATAFKGIPASLLEKVRARQAAKALETMTRSATASKEATSYSRLPHLAKTLRSIFVAEKKGVLTLEFVIAKLDNSFPTKLTVTELDELIRLLCKLLPTWTSIQIVRKVEYLKLAKNVDLTKVIKRLQILANDKVTRS